MLAPPRRLSSIGTPPPWRMRAGSLCGTVEAKLMTVTVSSFEYRPRDFTARLSRNTASLGERRKRQHLGRRLAVLAAAMAVPAMAAPVDWTPSAPPPVGPTPMVFPALGAESPGLGS
jgi:hypothetical protein